MSEKLNVLMIGDNQLAPYHPLENVEPLMGEMLEDLATISFMVGLEQYEIDLRPYDCIIVYSDNRKELLSDQAADNLKAYVDGGGSLLVMHSGITVMNKEGLEVLTGARLLPHKDMASLKFTYEKHEITDDLEPMEIFEEPYEYEVIEGISREVFLKYTLEGNAYDSGWLCRYGNGLVAVLHPGHNDFTLENPEYEEIIRKTLLYITGKLA